MISQTTRSLYRTPKDGDENKYDKFRMGNRTKTKSTVNTVLQNGLERLLLPGKDKYMKKIRGNGEERLNTPSLVN